MTRIKFFKLVLVVLFTLSLPLLLTYFVIFMKVNIDSIYSLVQWTEGSYYNLAFVRVAIATVVIAFWDELIFGLLLRKKKLTEEMKEYLHSLKWLMAVFVFLVEFFNLVT